jgi:hypothetical protein
MHALYYTGAVYLRLTILNTAVLSTSPFKIMAHLHFGKMTSFRTYQLCIKSISSIHREIKGPSIDNRINSELLPNLSDVAWKLTIFLVITAIRYDSCTYLSILLETCNHDLICSSAISRFHTALFILELESYLLHTLFPAARSDFRKSQFRRTEMTKVVHIHILGVYSFLFPTVRIQYMAVYTLFEFSRYVHVMVVQIQTTSRCWCSRNFLPSFIKCKCKTEAQAWEMSSRILNLSLENHRASIFSVKSKATFLCICSDFESARLP